MKSTSDLPWRIQSDSMGVFVVNAQGQRLLDVIPEIGAGDPFVIAKRITDAVQMHEQAVEKLAQAEKLLAEGKPRERRKR